MMPVIPCYDKKTCTDCPDRYMDVETGIGCKSTCEKWKAYEEQRNKQYELRKQEAQRIGFEISVKRNIKNPKYK